MPSDCPSPPSSGPRGVRTFSGHRLAPAGALAVLALAGSTLLPACGGGTAASGAADAASATVERKAFVRTVRVGGLTEPVQSYTVMAPRLAGPGMTSLVLTRLVKAGARVKQGDLLAEFDRQTQIRTALDRRAEFLDLGAQIAKKRAEQDATTARDGSELKQAENALERAKLEMLKNEMLSAIEAEKNQQDLEEAEARLKQLRETFALKRRAAAAELRILEIQRDRAKGAMENAERNASKMAIASPLDGLIVLKQVFKGGTMGEVQEGEEVRSGMPILEVVNSSSMRVRGRVNQADLPYVRVGMPALVRLDAYPEKAFPGRLEQLTPVGMASDMAPKVRTFVGIFSIEGDDRVLMPDLSAAVDVEIERVPDVLVAPRDAVLTSGGRTTARVKDGNRFVERAVTLGAVSEHEVVVTSGLNPGDVILRHVTAPGRSGA